MTNANAPKPPEAPKVKRCGVCGSALVLNRLFARPDSWVCVKAGCPAWRWDDEKAPGAWSVLRKPAPAPDPASAPCTCGEYPPHQAGDHISAPAPEPKQGIEEPIEPVTELEAEKSTSKILRAQLVQAISERDEARATKDMHKERQEEAWAEVDALRAELSAIKRQAEDATEYVLAVDNRELRREIEGLRIRVGEYEDMTEINKRFSEIEAELASAREERDKFEAESEQKGADLMAAEGVIAEIIDAYERSASSELGQLIEDARAARAKESQ